MNFALLVDSDEKQAQYLTIFKGICSQTWTYLNTRDEEMVDRVFAFRDEFREYHFNDKFKQ